MQPALRWLTMQFLCSPQESKFNNQGIRKRKEGEVVKKGLMGESAFDLGQRVGRTWLLEAREESRSVRNRGRLVN